MEIQCNFFKWPNFQKTPIYHIQVDPDSFSPKQHAVVENKQKQKTTKNTNTELCNLTSPCLTMGSNVVSHSLSITVILLKFLI